MVDDQICSTWEWSRAPRSGSELEELRQLLLLCQGVVLEGGTDTVGWELDGVGGFSVSSLKDRLKDVRFAVPNYTITWNNWVPGKVGILAWRAELNRVPVLSILYKRNIIDGSLDCPACGESEETTEHFFVSCGLAQEVWQAITLWCKVPYIFAFSVRDILDLYKFTKFPRRKAKYFHAVCLVSIWCLWKARNDMVFNGLGGHGGKSGGRYKGA
ncbi:uncharacterized protein LOC143538932 [Bidens hawaiensis]|uniref:uncharacterized protein LOC143538932 n=1 Tax=Bidens hawaiensis TaxID=980011 RepID=UPI00404A92C4